MKKYNIGMKIIMLLGVFAEQSLRAKFIATNHDEQIQETLRKYMYTIVCINDQNQQSASEIKRLKNNFRIASKSRLYDHLLKKDIAFLWIEMNDKNAAEIKTILNIQHIPGCALFAQTKKLVDVNLHVQANSLTFLDMLQNNLQNEIQDLQELREEEEAKARQEKIDQEARYGFYPYYAYYYDASWYNGPYWGAWGWSGGRAAWGSNRGYWNHSDKNEHETGNIQARGSKK